MRGKDMKIFLIDVPRRKCFRESQKMLVNISLLLDQWRLFRDINLSK